MGLTDSIPIELSTVTMNHLCTNVKKAIGLIARTSDLGLWLDTSDDHENSGTAANIPSKDYEN